ncbi:hypothetical protein TNCV_1609341 [Trichonephila clavipes]|nr:hypothetical protein TNCV_1609341 [Trichonephila clavipes]
MRSDEGRVVDHPLELRRVFFCEIRDQRPRWDREEVEIGSRREQRERSEKKKTRFSRDGANKRSILENIVMRRISVEPNTLQRN